jgi:hypothetical protein
MIGSALEQDLARARFNKQALGRHERVWDSSHHPDASESWRYVTADYFESAIAKTPGQPPSPYGYQDPIDASRPTVSYNQNSGGESYAGGNAFESERGGGGGYGTPWGQT